MNPTQTISSSPDRSVARHRLPFETMTTKPPKSLRIMILQISQETGRKPADVLHSLLAQAAGAKVDWITVRPQCGDKAGVSLSKVEEHLERVYFRLRDTKGTLATYGTDAQRVQIEEVLSAALELWAHAQSLAAETFYTNAQIIAGRRVFNTVAGWLRDAIKQEADEVAKGQSADAKVLQRTRSAIPQFTLVVEMLARLGFSPEGVCRAA